MSGRRRIVETRKQCERGRGSRAVFWASVCGVVVLAGVFYGNTLVNGFVWDDEAVILNAEGIRSLKNLPLLFSRRYFREFAELSYRPVVTASYFVDYALWGLRPFGYHLTNVLVHAGASVAVLLLLRMLPSMPQGAAFAGAAFFVIHPVNTEAVNSIGFREDLLCGLFYFLALCLYLKGRQGGGWGWLAGSWAAFALAVYAKEMALSLPAVLVGYEVVIPSCDETGADRVWRVRKLAVLVAPFALIALSVLMFRWGGFRYESVRLSVWGGSMAATVANVPRAFVRYIGWIVMPMHLHVERNLYIAMGNWGAEAAACAVVLMVIAGAVVYGIRRWPLAAVGAVVFFVALLPVSNIVPLRYFLAERFLYVPMLGGAMVVAAVVGRAGAHLKGARRVAAIGGLVSAGLMLGVLVVQRNKDWRDSFALWSNTQKMTPLNFRIHYQLGVQYMNRARDARSRGVMADYEGQRAKGLEQFLRALRRNPRMGVAHYQIGLAALERGQHTEAARRFIEGLGWEPQLVRDERQAAVMQETFAALADAGRVEGYLGLGVVAWRLGDRDRANELVERARQRAVAPEERRLLEWCYERLR